MSEFQSNFKFLKKQNEKLYNIIIEAECLFRDEYFEQCIVQIRRFAENLCRDILSDKAYIDETFDDLISRIKDNSSDNTRMKEFSEDLYFLKKQGNKFAHASTSVSIAEDGKIAIECLERAFEIAIFYSNTKFGYNKKLDNAVFSEEMLMTGKSTSKNNLKNLYSEKLEKTRKSEKPQKKKSKSSIKNPRKKKNSETSNEKPRYRQENQSFWVPLSLIFIIIIILFLLSFIKV